MNLYQTILAIERKASEQRPADQVSIRLFSLFLSILITIKIIFLSILITNAILTLTGVRSTLCGDSSRLETHRGS